MTYDHDALFKHTYQQPENAASLLRSILPAALAAAIDWDSLQLLPGTSVDESLQARHADLLFTANLRGQRVLLYVVLEHKSYDDRFSVLQLLRYEIRVYDRYLQENPDATSLPPIVPIVVHHGERGWRAPRTMLDLIDLTSLPSDLRDLLGPLQPNATFLLDDLASTSEEELQHRSGTSMDRLTKLLLQFVRPAAERDPAEFVRRWRDLMTALWHDPRGRSGMIALFSYLASQLEAPREHFAAAAALIHQDARTMGKTIADQFREEGFQKGLELAERRHQEGKSDGSAEVLLRLLWRRFGTVSPATEQRLRNASSAQLLDWAERLLSAERIDDIFA